jgi:hypothetical protein
MNNNKVSKFVNSWNGIQSEELGQYGPKVKTPTFQEMVDDHKVTALPWFQREGGPDGGSGWSEQNCKEFVGNLLRGQAMHTIFRADVQMNIYNAIQNNDFDSKEFYEDYAKEGMKYVSGDGYNGSASVHNFFEEDMSMFDPVTKDYIGYAELPEKTKNRLYYGVTGTRIITLTNISSADFCELTRKQNLAVAWTRQEQRRCRPVPLSYYIRDTALANNVFYQELCFGNTDKGRDNIARYGGEEQLVKLYNMVLGKFEKNNNPDDLDKLYEDPDKNILDKSTVDTVDKIMKISKDCTVAIIKYAKENEGVGYKAFGGAGSLAFQHFVSVSLDLGLRPKDSLSFMRAWMSLHTKLKVKANTINDADKEDKYTHWLRVSQFPNWYNKIRQVYIEAIKSNEEEWIKNDVFYARKRSSDDRFTEKQRLEIYEKVIGEGKDIDVLNVYMVDDIGLMWESDHKIPVILGGDTTTENGDLLKRTPNRIKGPTLPQDDDEDCDDDFEDGLD